MMDVGWLSHRPPLGEEPSLDWGLLILSSSHFPIKGPFSPMLPGPFFSLTKCCQERKVILILIALDGRESPRAHKAFLYTWFCLPLKTIARGKDDKSISQVKKLRLKTIWQLSKARRLSNNRTCNSKQGFWPQAQRGNADAGWRKIYNKDAQGTVERKVAVRGSDLHCEQHLLSEVWTGVRTSECLWRWGEIKPALTRLILNTFSLRTLSYIYLDVNKINGNKSRPDGFSDSS